MTLKKVATSAAILAAGTSTAFAGGLDRSTFSSAILFEKGNYAEIAYGVTTPKVSATGIPNSDVAESFSTLRGGVKFDLSPKIAVALTFNNNPIGADINYAPTALGAGFANAAGFVEAQAVTALGKYKFTNNISAYAGVKYQNVSATADLTVAGGAPFTFPSEAELGYIAGVAYEKPEIALRVALSYESKIDYTLNTTLAAGLGAGTVVGTTTAATPEAWTLEFQTGVAPNTLVFGSVRRALWSDANIVVNGSPLTTFEDTTNYNLGVGYRFNDTVSGSFALTYEAPDGTLASAFAPTDGIFGGSVGVAVKVGKGFKVSGGISFTNRGDTFVATPGGPLGFSDNSVTTVGVKLSKNF